MIAFESSMFTKPRPGARMDRLHPINRGLVAWWLFNEGAGTRIADTENGNPGTVTNVDLTTAWSDGGITMDGVDDFITVPDVSSFSGLSRITVVVRVKSLSAASVKTAMSHDGGDPNSSWRLNQAASGILQVILSDDGTSDPGHVKLYQSSAGFVPFDGTWHQAGFTFNAGTLELWVDGKRDPSPAKIIDGAITSLNDSASGLEFGRRTAGSEWNGKISYAKLYDRALNAREMLLLNTNPFSGLLA